MRAEWKITGEKSCKACGLTKPLAAYYLNCVGHPMPKCRQCYKVKDEDRQRAPPGAWKASGTKRCPRCDVTKPLSGFAMKKTGNPEGRCRTCAAEITRNTYASLSPSAQRERNSRVRLRASGVSLEKYATMLADQKGACAICGTTTPGFREYKNGKASRFSVDHCHTTSKIRGLLCVKCNAAIGLVGDSLPVLQRAMEYLRANGAVWR